MNPRHWFRRLFPTARRLLVERSLHSLKLPDYESVLIVGTGHDPYRSMFHRVKEYVRLDIEPVIGITDVVANALALPFGANRFDCIFATEVIEHLSNPFIFAREITRVLKPGGTIILTVPFIYHQHADPNDFWRPTHKGLLELFNNCREVKVIPHGNRLHAISDLITTAFSPYPIFFPLRILNHLLVTFSKVIFSKHFLQSTAPCGYLLIGTK